MSALSALCKDETANVLIVEGKNDCHGVYQIAARTGLAGTFGIWQGDNDTQAVERFGGLLVDRKRPEILGIMLDCDPDATGTPDGVTRRWNQISNRLSGYRYPLPAEPAAQGIIVDGPEGLPRVGIWLMPDNQSEGMFEDFLLSQIPKDALEFARQTVRTARKDNFGTYKLVHESKAVAHCYLSWQDEPGYPLGIAIKSGLFNLENETARRFVGWLDRLFRPAAA
jgi:hypothetical protein